MIEIKKVHLMILVATALFGLVVTSVTATYTAMRAFPSVAYAEKSRDMIEDNAAEIAEMEDKGKLKWLETEKREWELDCTDKITDEWICSPNKKERYEQLILDINLIRHGFGLPLVVPIWEEEE